MTTGTVSPRRSSSTAFGSVAALAFAVGALLALALSQATVLAVPESDSFVALLWITGYLLVVAAGITCIAVMTQVIREAFGRRRPALVDVLLIAAAIIVVVGTVTLYPVIGSGGASA